MVNTVSYTQEHINAAVTIQSYWKGYKVRQNTILPKHFTPRCSQSLCAFIDENIPRDSIVLTLARLVNNFYPLRLKAFLYPPYSIPFISSDIDCKLEKRAPRLACRIDLERAGKTSRTVHLIFLDRFIGQGYYKSVYSSFTLHINFKTKQIQWAPSILTRSTSPESEYAALANVIKGINAEREVYGSNPPFNWPMVKKVSRISNYFSLETTREYFPHVLDIYISQTNRKLPLYRKLNLFIQIIDTLREWHRKGWVHNDVKMDNIFIREDGTPYLGDCDLAEKIQYKRDFRRSSYDYWSTARSYGYITPECDIYALITATTYMVFGNPFFPYLKNPFQLMNAKNQKALFAESAKEQDSKYLSIARRELFKLFMSTFEKGLLLNAWLQANPQEAEKLNWHDPEILQEIERRTISLDQLKEHIIRIQGLITP
ncbi:MAG: serine/threonine-protein kinase [Waddliaceae bacterium]